MAAQTTKAPPLAIRIWDRFSLTIYFILLNKLTILGANKPTPNDPVQPPARKEQERTRQTSTRVGWNGGLGGWAERQCRGFMDFALFLHSAEYAEYHYCALPCLHNTYDRSKHRP